MVVKFCGSTMWVKYSQNENALDSIVVTPSGIIIESILLFWNALVPIEIKD